MNMDECFNYSENTSFLRYSDEVLNGETFPKPLLYYQQTSTTTQIKPCIKDYIDFNRHYKSLDDREFIEYFHKYGDQLSATDLSYMLINKFNYPYVPIIRTNKRTLLQLIEIAIMDKIVEDILHNDK